MSAALPVLTLADWRPHAAPPSDALIERLERGAVLLFPDLGFALNDEEQALLDPAWVDRGRKNVSLTPLDGHLNGISDPGARRIASQLLERYYRFSLNLLEQLFVAYRGNLHHPTTSLRLHAIANWSERSSWRKDDRRLHIDAFPSRPIHGDRILRVFSNINPDGQPRRWRLGSDFESLCRRYLSDQKGANPLHTWLLAQLKITKRRRSDYDHLMLRLHDRMKADERLQEEPANTVDFPAGSTWICFSDQAAHAVSAGQFMLEQTVLLPVTAMQDPQRSPLAVLERLKGRRLA